MGQMDILLFLCLLGAFLPAVIDAADPPLTWKEHWFEHNQDLTRVFFDGEVAIYFDKDVSPTVIWPNSYLHDLWVWTKITYGNFGIYDNRLFAVFHTNKYSGGHPATYLDPSHDNRNVIDCGPFDWKSKTDQELTVLTHEVAHIVEFASKGISGSPAFGVWGDSKWAEIFVYDMYRKLRMDANAQRAFDGFIATQDSFPRASTFWFRDWFYPIYSRYGESAVLNRFFELLAANFPKKAANAKEYDRGMNMGEFVHFWSGAAGANLKEQARTAFGWTAENDAQLTLAQNTFRGFTYDAGVARFYQNCVKAGYSAGLPIGDYNLGAMQRMGLLNDDISSMTVNPGYKVELFADDNFTGATITLTTSLDCLTANGWNDRTSSLRVKKI